MKTAVATSRAQHMRELEGDWAAWRHLPFLALILVSTILVLQHWFASDERAVMLSVASGATLVSTIAIVLSTLRLGSRVHFDRMQGACIVSYFVAAYLVISTTGSGDSAFFPMIVAPMLWLATVGQKFHLYGGLASMANVLIFPVTDTRWHVSVAEKLSYVGTTTLVLIGIATICIACHSFIRNVRTSAPTTVRGMRRQRSALQVSLAKL